MKEVLDIYVTDWRRIARSKAAIFLIIALMFLPSLYAWFNIKALWDPYGNTSGISIAVANDDQDFSIEGKNINIGNSIIKKLQKNPSLGWNFVSKEEADKGVENGDYYASLYIPADFSKDLASILSGTPQKAEIIFTVNDKINAITPKITATGANSVTNQVSQEFIDTVSQALLSELNKIGVQLDKELPTIRKLESKLYQIRNALPEIKKFGEQAQELEKKIPVIQTKINKVVSIAEYIPPIHEAGQSLIKVTGVLPYIDQAGEQLLILQERIPDIRSAAKNVSEFNTQFAEMKQTLNQVINEANQSISELQSAQSILPSKKELSTNIFSYGDGAEQYSKGLTQSFRNITSLVNMNLDFVKQIAKSAEIISKELQNRSISDEQALTILALLDHMLIQQDTLVTIQLENIQSLYDNGVDSQSIKDFLTSIKAVRSFIQTDQKNVQNIFNEIKAEGIKQGSSIVRIHNDSLIVRKAIEETLLKYNDIYSPVIQTTLNQMVGDERQSNESVQIAQAQLPNVSGILANTEKTLENVSAALKKFQDNLPILEETLQNTINKINDNLDKTIKGLNNAADFYRNDFPQVKNQLEKGSNFIKNDLPGIEKKITDDVHIIQDKAPRFIQAVRIAGDLARNELPQFDLVISNTTNKLDKVKQNINLETIIKVLHRDVKANSDFIAHPVVLKEVKKFPIENYGSASSPFYTALAIWVGALLLVSMLSVDVEMPNKMYKPYHFYFGRGLTFLSIALIQALIVSLGDIFLLGVDVNMKTAFVLFSLLISFVFVTIVYTLVSIFGNIGKGLAIILLVLQISSSGGNFPIEVSSEFFQRIYPFLPFTYAVKLLREALGGVIWNNAWLSIGILCTIAFLFIVLGTVLKKPLMRVVDRFTEDAKKSKILH